MSTIQLTSDGYSIHTMELKLYPEQKEYEKIRNRLYRCATGSHCGTTYPMSRYHTEEHEAHCSTLLSKNGVLLYLTSTKLHLETVGAAGSENRMKAKAVIKAVVNPRKVLDPDSSYLGIMPADADSFERFQDCFTELMRKYGLPEFLDQWKLTRLDL